MEMMKFLWTLFYVNLFTIGGGYVMLPILHTEIVDNYHWLTNQEFVQSIAIGQLTPGPLTIMNVFIGYKIWGFLGAVGALISSYLPSMIVATIVSRYYLQFKNSWIVNSSFKGIRPAVIGLLCAVGVTLAGESIIDFSTTAIAVGTFLLIALAKSDPTFVILGAGALGALLY